MAFPATRMRRLRKTASLRGLTRETELSPGHLDYPKFVVAGGERRTPIPTMPGIDHLSIDGAVEEAGEAADVGHALAGVVPGGSEQQVIGLVAP